MSRANDTFLQRVELTRQFPPFARVAALAAGLSVCSASEARTLVPELIELAAHDLSAPRPRAVRLRLLNWWKNRADANRRRVADRALEAIIRHWDRVPPDLVPLVASAGRGRFAVANDASTDPDPKVRANVVAAAGELGEGHLARLIGGMLSDQDAGVAAAAEHALVHLALGEFARTRTGEATLDPRLVDQLWRVRLASEFGFPHENQPFFEPRREAAPSVARAGVIDGIATACEGFEQHRHRGVLVCAMLLLDRARVARGRARGAQAEGGDRLAGWFAHPAGDAHSALRTVLRASVLPIAGLRAMEWVGQEPWTRAGLERLSRGGSLLEHELALSAAHLAKRPRRARAISRMVVKSRPAKVGASEAGGAPGSAPARVLEEGLLPDGAIVSCLSIDAGRGAARLVGLVQASAPDRELAARAFLGHGDPVARHAVMRMLPSSGLHDWVFDSLEQVSVGAVLRMSRLDDPRGSDAEESEVAWWRQVTRSPSPRTRFLAHEELATRAEPLAGTLRGRLIASRRLAREPESVVASIYEALGRESDQAGAILLTRKLGLASRFQDRMIELAMHAADAKVAATAVAALADCASHASMDATVGALGHADPRVRANAIETLGRRVRGGESLPAQVIELKHDGHHRVRANALRLELGLAPAAAPLSELEGMLRDARPEHRWAGAWLASRALGGGLRRALGPGADPLAMRLVELASGDPDDRVRRRAAIGASRLMGELRASWRSGSGAAALAGSGR